MFFYCILEFFCCKFAYLHIKLCQQQVNEVRDILMSTFRWDALTSTGLMKDGKGQRGITPTEFGRILFFTCASFMHQWL